jgi:RecA-family ATPase
LNWFDIPSLETAWLVDGLIPSDGHAAICGKPKAGKSTFIRNLIASVIKGRKFIGRSIDLPAGSGRVLYVHLDRKDQPWRVAQELRDLGITQDESARLAFRTAQDLPSESFDDRLKWLKKEVKNTKPHLLVIDLMWQFVVAQNSNDYNRVLAGINLLQDALTDAKYKGALVVALHGRKSTNPNDPADDILGSTGQRGSFSTNILLSRHRKQNVYTIMSDQTIREAQYGEIDERVITRNDDLSLSLGQPFEELTSQDKKVKDDASFQRLLAFIGQNPDCEMGAILSGLSISKKSALKLMDKAGALIRVTGEGIKGNPHKYALDEDYKTSQSEVGRLTATYGD